MDNNSYKTLFPANVIGNEGAIAALFAFIVGIYIAIPSKANIGYMIVDALANSSPHASFLKLVPFFKIMFNLLGIGIVVGDITFIIQQAKEGNFF